MEQFKEEIKSAIPFEVDSLDDLLRWIVSSSQGQHGTIFYFKKADKVIYSTLNIVSGYYNLRGLPILLYTKQEEEPKANFIRYDIRKEADAKSKILFTSGFDDRDSNLGFIQYIPIIKLKKIPKIFEFDS